MQLSSCVEWSHECLPFAGADRLEWPLNNGNGLKKKSANRPNKMELTICNSFSRYCFPWWETGNGIDWTNGTGFPEQPKGKSTISEMIFGKNVSFLFSRNFGDLWSIVNQPITRRSNFSTLILLCFWYRVSLAWLLDFVNLVSPASREPLNLKLDQKGVFVLWYRIYSFKCPTSNKRYFCLIKKCSEYYLRQIVIQGFGTMFLRVRRKQKQ